METIPRYEWHYVCPADWLDDPGGEAGRFTPKGTALQLELMSNRESHPVLSIACQISSPVESLRAYATDILNERLAESLKRPNGLLDAFVDEVLFRQQVTEGVARAGARNLLELPPPHCEDAAVRSILVQSRGWLMWNWQLRALLMTAGCTARLAEQITLAHKMLYPRTDRFLGSLSVGRETVLDIVRKGSGWGGGAVNMSLPAHLLDLFEAREGS